MQVLFKRMLGNKKYPNWSVKTEIIWATSRMTLLASNKYGLLWLKRISQKFMPKPTLKKQINIDYNSIKGINYIKVTPRTIAGSNKTVVYFHGGGYTLGSPEASLEFTTKLSEALKTVIVIPKYPTAPEAEYPKAQIACLDFVKEIMKDHDNLILAGDSAGAALVLSTFENLDTTERKNIHGTVLISPWVDPVSEIGSINYNNDNDIGDRTFVTNCYKLYLGNKMESPNYPMSFHVDNIPRLPKTFIGVGTSEILLDQTEALKTELTKNDTPTHYKLYPNMFHTFWNFSPTIPEASQLIDDISSWMTND